ncbi:hypothetical protein RHGRI_006759 [Rhododendron griersonianum]|uniref:Chlororespiratory reduction 41 n=1 Tax=Rhododendron griersonianum TaxID=479676 RepID=A0AAV6KVX6_9ERIC|nr:hypothetical protein RHGRI_006759 [Rhododendron griersonianum]
MASTLAFSLPLFPCTRTSPHRKTNRALSTTVSASLRNENYGRLVVDENLIVLRERIHEMKRELMGLLQTWMMDARPCLVLGAILVVALSVPAAGAVSGFQMPAVIEEAALSKICKYGNGIWRVGDVV